MGNCYALSPTPSAANRISIVERVLPISGHNPAVVHGFFVGDLLLSLVRLRACKNFKLLAENLLRMT